VGIISHSTGGGLAASLSSSDLCGLLPEQFAAALSMPVLQYLQAKSSAGWAVQQQQQQQQQQQAASPKPQPLGQLQQQAPSSMPALLQQRPEQLGSAHLWGLKVRAVQQLCSQQLSYTLLRHDPGLSCKQAIGMKANCMGRMAVQLPQELCA
jgi:hypothetical protein